MDTKKRKNQNGLPSSIWQNISFILFCNVLVKKSEKTRKNDLSGKKSTPVSFNQIRALNFFGLHIITHCLPFPSILPPSRVPLNPLLSFPLQPACHHVGSGKSRTHQPLE
jgi:hypothetical protein